MDVCLCSFLSALRGLNETYCLFKTDKKTVDFASFVINNN